MFDSLNDQMKHDIAGMETTTERTVKWVAVMVVSVLLFGGLYLAVRTLE
jgi:hypothetical protein